MINGKEAQMFQDLIIIEIKQPKANDLTRYSMYTGHTSSDILESEQK